MHSKFITKMTNHFSELGSIIYSKACDYSSNFPISKDDIKMYYEVLISNDVFFPEKISRRNHLTCCLYYLSKDDNKYKDIFIDKFLKTMNIKELEENQESLVFVFNLIEYDKAYLHSPKNHLLFLYQALKFLKNVETNLENYILVKYFKGYIKYCVGEYKNSQKDYYEAFADIAESSYIKNFYINYIRLRNDLLKVELYNRTRLEKSFGYDFREHCQFLKDLFNEVKFTNKILALRLGFDLLSVYFEKKKFEDSIPILIEMDSLKGTTLNGIDYYLAINSRLGYIGVLLDDKKVIKIAIEKIKKVLDIIKIAKSKKLINITKSYNFVLAILKISLDKKEEYDIKSIAYEFQKSFLPDLNSKSSLNYLINNNRNDIIINFKVVNNMNREITNTAKTILINCVNELNKRGDHNSTFLTFLVAVNDKIYWNAKSYINDSNEKMRKYYKTKIYEYGKGTFNIIYKYYYDEEPLLETKFMKALIINILSTFAHVCIYEKDFDELIKLINFIDDLIKKLKIEETLPAFALINKIKGELCLYKKDYNAVVFYYEKAIALYENKSPKFAPMIFNLAFAYFLTGNKVKAKEYLNRCINEYNNLSMEKDIFNFMPDIKEKLDSVQKLLKLLS